MNGFAASAPFWHPAWAQGILFDWDGVLAETRLSFAPIYERFFGGKRVMLLEVLPQLEEGIRKELEQALFDVEMDGAENAEPVPGAMDVLRWLEGRNMPWCVVSRNCRESVERAASVCGIPLPPFVFTRDVAPVKPEPGAFWNAARALGLPPRECVVVGDFLYDLIGARRAGMRALLVQRYDEGWRQWTDLSLPRMTDLVDVLETPRSLLPWEYAHLDPVWLERAWTIRGILPGASPCVGQVAERAAALGVGTLVVPGNFLLQASQWQNWSGLSCEWLGQPLVRVCRGVLGARYPFLEILEGEEGTVLLPPDPDEVAAVFDAHVSRLEGRRHS